MNELAERINNELIPIYSYDDEYDIPRKFRKALELGKEVADNLVECKKNNDENMIKFYNDLLNRCYSIFNGHYWGENYKKDLDTYIKRKKSGQKSTIDHTKELESQILEALKELEEYMKNLYPLENPEFRNAEENEHINALKTKINELKKQYAEEYSYLSPDEKNTLGINHFIENRQEQRGLETIKNYDDEYEILKKFKKALEIGKATVDMLAEYDKNNNQLGIDRCNRIIDACINTFNGHYWGERYKNELIIYKEKFESNKKTSMIDDTNDKDYTAKASDEKNIPSSLDDKDIVYERAIKTYGGGGANTEYYPVMENGLMIVEKTSVGGIAVLGSNYGVIDNLKNEVVPCIYDSCEPINEEYFIVGKDYTYGGMSGDDFSFPKQKYGIVDSNGNIIVPLEMDSINYKNGYVSIRGFNNDYYIGLINNGKLEISEALSYTIRDSLEDVYNAISGTNKITAIGMGFILRDGDYANYDELKKAYCNFINMKNNSQVSESISNEKSNLKHR